MLLANRSVRSRDCGEWTEESVHNSFFELVENRIRFFEKTFFLFPESDGGPAKTHSSRFAIRQPVDACVNIGQARPIQLFCIHG